MDKNNNIEIVKDYYDNVNIHSEHYHLKYKLHNENGPAIIIYNKDGTIKSKSYYLNDELHNSNGPAIVFYHKDGTIKSEYYYYYNQKVNVSSIKELKLWIKILPLQ